MKAVYINKKRREKPETTISRPDCVMVSEVRDVDTLYPASVTVFKTYSTKTYAPEYQIEVKCGSPACSRSCILRTYLPYVPGSVARGQLAAALFSACDMLERVPLDIEPRAGQHRLM